MSENSEIKTNEFCEYHFFASNIKEIVNDENIQITYDSRFYSKIPFKIMYKTFVLFTYKNIHNISFSENFTFSHFTSCNSIFVDFL